MTYPEGFVAEEFFTPTDEQKANYYITGQNVKYYFSETEYGAFTYVNSKWKEFLYAKPPIVYYLFGDDNCWVSRWKTTSDEEFLDYRVAVRKDSPLFTDLVNTAEKHKW